MGYIGNSVVGVEHPSTSALNATTGTFTGNITTTGTVEPAGDTAAGDAAALGFTSAEGLILTGQGSTSDITVKNDADAVVFSVPTGTDDILFPDNAKAIFGAGSDLKIYHNGSSSFIEDSGTGNLTILANEFRLNNAGNTENMITAAPDGAVELYHNDTKRIETTSTGVEVNDSAGGQVTFRYTGNSGFGAIKTDGDSNILFSAGATSFSEVLRITSGGLAIGGTGAANTLDDYEEGTFTPAWTGGYSSAPSYSEQLGTYTKIGRLVQVQIRIAVSSGSRGGSALTLANLPFTSRSANPAGGGFTVYQNNFHSADDYYPRVDQNSTIMRFHEENGTVVNANELDADNYEIEMIMIYESA